MREEAGSISSPLTLDGLPFRLLPSRARPSFPSSAEEDEQEAEG
jgi:hypothetical protein